MHIDLTNHTAVVTGSTVGIGFAIAKGLAACGAEVVLNGRTQVAVERAAAALTDAVPKARVRSIVADLGTAEGCAAFVDAVPSTDILVNNIGIYGPQDFFETSDEDWTRMFEVNVMSGVRLARAYLPGMAARNWGRVIFLSSESGLNIPSDMIHYGFSKTAVLAVSRGLAKRMAGTGVTVNAVLPGPTMTEGVEAMLANASPEAGMSIEELGTAFVKANRPSSIIQRMATPDEVANMVVYTCSRLASATTGAALRVDGGVVDTIA